MYEPKAPPPPGFVPPPTYEQAQSQGFAPPYGAPPPTAGPNVVIVQTLQLGSEPQSMVCPFCHVHITTRVEAEPTLRTHLSALLCCLLQLYICAPCVYCMDTCLGKKHYCPNCAKFIGQFNG